MRLDLRQTDEAEREENLQEILQEEARRGFDLSRGPLIRAKLIRLAEDEHALAVTMHHIVSDGWSMEIIVRELAQLYDAFSQGEESPLPELEIQYADYAVWQREWLQGEVLERQLEYWKRELEAVAVLDLPTDGARVAAASYRGASERMWLSQEVTEKLKQQSQREGVTLFMSLLAGLQVLLARYSGQQDIAVGTPIAGRNRAEIEGLIGFFVNTLVMRVDLGGNPYSERVAGKSEREGAGSICESGCAVREAGRGDAAGEKPEPHAAVSGDDGLSEQAKVGCGDGDIKRRGGGDGSDDGKIRSAGVADRYGERDIRGG